MRLRLARLAVATLAAVALAAGCSRLGTEPSAEKRTDALAVTVRPDGLRLENLTDAPLFYLATDPASLVLIDLNPCTSEPQTCTTFVPARGVRTVPFDEVAGFRSDTHEVNVLHWHVVPRAGGGGKEAHWFPLLTVPVR